MSEEIKEYLQPGKKNLILIYILYLTGLLVPPFPFVGAAFAYANKSHSNKVWRSHYLFALRTFYLGLAGWVVVYLTSFMYIGPIFRVLILGWLVVRSILALQFLFQESPHPNPQTLWIK